VLVRNYTVVALMAMRKLRTATANGAYSFGLAQIEFMGEITAGRNCGSEGRVLILGVTALESVGIRIDPANQTVSACCGSADVSLFSSDDLQLLARARLIGHAMVVHDGQR
jgi:hypothetical protein